VIILLNFIVFSLLIFASDALVTFSTVRLERRVGASVTPIFMFFNVLPSYLRNILSIFIVFAAVELAYLHILDSRLFVFMPLLIIFLTTVKVDPVFYTQCITSSAYLLSVVIAVITAQCVGTGSSAIINNPFSFISFVLAVFAIFMFNKNNAEPSSMNIARNLALNIYIVSVFMPEISFIYSALFALGLFYLQFLVQQVYPKFNLFQSMRQSLTVILFASFFCFMGNLLWVMFLEGGI
jgi:hypothetical protein